MDDEFTPVKPQRDTRLLDPDTGQPYVSSRGRKYGQIDLIDGDIRAHVYESFKHVGGARYFEALAQSQVPSDRTAYVGLLAKCMPTQVNASVDIGMTVELVSYAQQAALARDKARTVEMAPGPHPAHASPLLD